MILEGIVTTCDAAGRMHLAAMGPQVDERECSAAAIERLTLKPFDTSQTAANLAAVPEGVFHLVDDVLVFAHAVTKTSFAPPCRPAREVRGWVLDDACAAYEFRIEATDASQSRIRHEARVVARHAGRPFMGFNRGRHAVVEAAILVTRLHLLEADEVSRQMAALAPLVEKTGGSREREAWALIERAIVDSREESGRNA